MDPTKDQSSVFILPILPVKNSVVFSSVLNRGKLFWVLLPDLASGIPLQKFGALMPNAQGSGCDFLRWR